MQPLELACVADSRRDMTVMPAKGELDFGSQDESGSVFITLDRPDVERLRDYLTAWLAAR